MSNIRSYEDLVEEIIKKIKSINGGHKSGLIKVLFSNDKMSHTIESFEFQDSFDIIKEKWNESKLEFEKLLQEGETVILFYIDFPKNSYVALYKGYKIDDISRLVDLKVFITRNY